MKPPLIVVIGPTASGKSQLAIALAKQLRGEVVSADSRLIYRGMDKGTAKPTVAEMEGIPHHLIDIRDPNESFSLAEYKYAATQKIEDIFKRGRLPFLVGGTGLYIKAVIENWSIPAIAPDRELRNIFEIWADEIGVEELFEKLNVLDPLAAEHIEPNNLRRIIRALEVIYKSGRLFSEQTKKGEPQYSLYQIGIQISRKELYEKIDKRVDEMMETGLVQEVESLLRKNVDPHSPALSAIGYKQTIDYFDGIVSYDDAVHQIKKKTREYVRRQSNWFKSSDLNIHWIENPLLKLEKTVEEITKYLYSIDMQQIL